MEELRYRHLAVIDHMIANPDRTQAEIAEALGYSQNWISLLIKSDLFKAEFQRRRREWEEDLTRRAQSKLFHLADKSADVLLEHLDGAKADPRVALDVQRMAIQSIGLGADRPSEDPPVLVDQSQHLTIVAPRENVERARERILNGAVGGAVPQPADGAGD